MPPAAAPGTKVAHAARTVHRLPASPERPIVSTIENPQGDHAPVRPMRSAARARLTWRTLIARLLARASDRSIPAARRPTSRGSSPADSAWDVRLVVGHAEDLAAPV